MAQDAPGSDEPTESLASDTPTTTGPTVASWPLDELMQEPAPEVGPVSGPLVWTPPTTGPAQRPVTHQPAYYVALTVAVMLVLGLVTGLVVLTVYPPMTRVAGTPLDLNLPELPAPTSSTPPGATTTTPPPPPGGEYEELAAHRLSTATTVLPDVTCSLPTFDPADTEQEAFYQASKVCADAVFGELGVPVEVVTVQGSAADTPCGVVEPDAPVTHCAGTVYLTPARLRDVEANGRYPGRYLGVFLREYALAVLDAGGLGDLVQQARSTGAAEDDLTLRLTQQATCLAGAASAAMADRGAVDANITTEIRDRLTDVDAPADAARWLDTGVRSRQPAACNTWR